MLKVRRSVTILSKKISWSCLQGLSWYIYKVNNNLKSKLKLIFWTTGNISEVQQQNHSVFYMKDHLTSTGTLNFSTTFISKNSRSPHWMSLCSVRGKSLKQKSYRPTAFASGNSSFCWNKDKLCQIAFIFFPFSLTCSALGVKQNYNKKTPHPITEPSHAWHWVMHFAYIILTTNLHYGPQFPDGETEIQL